MDVVIVVVATETAGDKIADPTHPSSPPQLNPQNVEAKKASSAVIGGGGLPGLEAAKSVADMSSPGQQSISL